VKEHTRITHYFFTTKTRRARRKKHKLRVLRGE